MQWLTHDAVRTNPLRSRCVDDIDQQGSQYDPPSQVALGLAFFGAVLAIAVSVIHIRDQGGISALKDPTYLGIGYWLLEAAGVVCAGLLLSDRIRNVGWTLALGVAAGPLAGIIISRSIGLPNATDDIGNWGETLGIEAMLVEAVLLTLAAVMLVRARRTA